MSIVNVEALKGLGAQLWWPGAVASANAPKAISANGDVKQVLPFSGAGIGMFDGTDDHLDVLTDFEDLQFYSNDFTIECIFYLNNITTTQYLFSQISSTSIVHRCYLNTSSGIIWAYYNSAYEWQIYTGISAITAKTWYHIALVRNGNTQTIYLNGNQVGSIGLSAASIPKMVGRFGIGWYTYNQSDFINGMISEFRITNGIARYTANFTPPRRQLESDSNTKLLLHFLGNNATFVDSSPSAHTITAYGDAKQLCSPCGSGVAYFDGTATYDQLTALDSSDWDFGSGAFEISMYWYPTSLSNGSGGSMLIGRGWDNSNRSWMVFCYSTGRVVFVMSTSGTGWQVEISSADGIISTLNQWYHICVSRDASNNTRIFINGIQSGTTDTTARTIYNTSNTLRVGYDYSGTSYHPVTGYLSEVIVKKGVADHTTTFTPPTQPFKPDPYTKLLLHMDGVGNAFYDSSDPPGDNGFPILPDGVTVTPNGTFTTQKMKDGRNIWKFDGSTNYITISDHASWSMFLNDFTIAAWIKFDSIAANKIIIGQYTDANNQWYLQWTTDNVIQLYGITSSTARFNYSCPLTAVANTWYHIVVERSGTSCIMYINGVAQTVTETTAFSATATDIAAVLSIGKIDTGYQTGNVKDLQIFTKALTTDQIGALFQETFIY